MKDGLGQGPEGQELGVGGPGQGESGNSEAASPPVSGEPKTYDEVYVKGLRAEAAGYRTKLRELEISVVRTKAAAKFGIGEEYLEFITAIDEEGASKQAEKLARGFTSINSAAKGARLPAAGGRNPANGGEQTARADAQDRFDRMRARVPALNGRVLRN